MSFPDHVHDRAFKNNLISTQRKQEKLNHPSPPPPNEQLSNALNTLLLKMITTTQNPFSCAAGWLILLRNHCKWLKKHQYLLGADKTGNQQQGPAAYSVI